MLLESLIIGGRELNIVSCRVDQSLQRVLVLKLAGINQDVNTLVHRRQIKLCSAQANCLLEDRKQQHCDGDKVAIGQGQHLNIYDCDDGFLILEWE